MNSISSAEGMVSPSMGERRAAKPRDRRSIANKNLRRNNSRRDSIELELLATELELKHVQPCDLSSSLSNKIADTIPAFSNKNINQPATQIISILPWLGWVAAACLFVFFNLPTGDGIQNISADLTQAKTELSDKEKTIIELESAKQELAKLNEKLSSELSIESGKIDALNTQQSDRLML